MGTVCAKKKQPQIHQVQQEEHTLTINNQQKNEIVSQPIISITPVIVPKKHKKIRDTVKAVTNKSEEGVKMLNDYVFDEFLGQGAFGKVKLAYKRGANSDKKFAIKILKKSKLKRQREYIKDKNGNLVIKDALQDVRREIAIMKKVTHPNLIQLFEVIDNPDSDKLFMVLEYAQGGQLIEWDDDEQIFYKCNEDTEINEELLISIFRDCIKGLHFLHQNGIVHRDLKPQNVLIGQNNVAKIADFGVSQILGDNDKLGNTQGTYHFMPPEACDKEKVKDGYSGKSADIWALGVTFYAFAFLNVPFNGDTVPEMMDTIVNQELHLPEGRSEQLNQFLKFILNKNPEQRPKILDIAKYQWLSQNLPSLYDEIIQEEQQVGVSDQEIENAYSLSSIMRIKSWATKWRTSSNLKKSSFQQLNQNQKEA